MDNFGSYKNFKFNWRIDDFHYNPGHILQSTTISIPPFSGVYWCLRLKLCEPGNLKSLECYLHRIPSEPGPDFIFVDFTLKVSGSTVCSRRESFGGVQFLNVEPFPQANSGLKLKMDVVEFPSRNAKLLVECEIHRQNVQDNYTTGFYHANSQALYEDMFALRANRSFSDVTLCVQHHVFLTHKAILDARLPLVASILNINYATQSEIEVFNISPSLIESLLHYAYSGCLVAGTFAELQQLHKIAGKLQLVDLQRLINTSANNCLARTSMNIQRKVVTWDMDPRISWINGHDMVAIIIPHNIGSAQTLTVSWGAVDIPTGKFLEFKFQFPSLLDERPIFMNCSLTAVRKSSVILKGKFHNLFASRTPWFTGPLVGRSLLDKHQTLMKLRLEIDLCDGEGKTSIEESEAEIVFPMPPCKNIEKLSYDLKNLLATGRFSDVTLVTDQHMEIRSHRAILATRSKTFFALLRQCALPGNRLPVNGVSNEALLFVLHYIYTGKVKDLNLTNVQEFNEAAKYFRLPALVSETYFFMEPSEQSPEYRYQAFV